MIIIIVGEAINHLDDKRLWELVGSIDLTVAIIFEVDVGIELQLFMAMVPVTHSNQYYKWATNFDKDYIIGDKKILLNIQLGIIFLIQTY